VSDDFDDELRDMARRALASIEITKTVPTPQWAARIARGNEVTVQENAEYQLAETLGLTPGASDATGLMLGARTRIERLQAETDLVAPLIEAVEAVRGHDKIDPDEPGCPIAWDQWAHIHGRLVDEVLRLVESLPTGGGE